MTKFLLWIILLIFYWPLALLALIAYPIVWLVLLPFRLQGMVSDKAFKLLRSVLYLPVRLLRKRSGRGPGR